jgi:hypothetical protein
LKIVILAIARTGSTSFANSIKNQDYYTLLEPYAYSRGKAYQVPPKEVKFHPKFCVKSVVTQTQGVNLRKDQIVDFNLKLVSKFDKVILLDRRDIVTHAQSLAHIGYLHSLEDKDLHRKYNYQDIPPLLESELYNNAYNILKESKDILKIISDKTQEEIVYYEDIFNKDKVLVNETLSKIFNDNLDIDQMVKDLDVIYKYRVTEKSLI